MMYYLISKLLANMASSLGTTLKIWERFFIKVVV